MNADLGGSGEDNLRNVRVRDKPLANNGTAARQDLQDVLWKPSLECEFTNAHRGERGQLGGLNNNGVSGGQRRCHTPAHDRHREVPRDDDTDNAQWLAEGDINTTRHRDLMAEQPFRGT